MTAAVDDRDELIERYAARIRGDAKPGQELSYAGALIDAMTDIESRFSLAARQQRTSAMLAAADMVRTERRHFSPTRGQRSGGTVNPQVSADSDSGPGGTSAGRGGRS